MDISEIRLRLDELLKIWQSKWTMLPGKVEDDDEDEHEHKDGKEHEEKDEEKHSTSLSQRKPVLVAATGSLTGLLGGVQKIERLYFYHTDHLGTPILMTDENGSVVWEAEYLPFGEVYQMSGTIENNLRFPGQYFDSETGLYYNWHRYYRAEVGRYIQADPVLLFFIMEHLKSQMNCRALYLIPSIESLMKKPERLNLFVYTVSNPVNHKDPSGLDMGVPVDPFNRGRGWCIECDWEDLFNCLIDVPQDPDTLMACANCRLSKGTDLEACYECIINLSSGAAICFIEECEYKTGEDCKPCP